MYTKILVACAGQPLKDRVATWLHDAGYIVLMAHDLAEAQKLANEIAFAAVIVSEDTKSQITIRADVSAIVVDQASDKDQFLNQVRRINGQKKNSLRGG